MNRMNSLGAACALCLVAGFSHADEWGTWNDLPNNLLESDQGVHSLDELSEQLDRLIQHNHNVDDGMRRQLLRHWMDRINSGTVDAVSLDRLIEMSEDWQDDDDLSDWYEDLEDFLDEQADLLEDRQDDLEDALDDDEDDEDSDDSEFDDEDEDDDDDSQ